MEDLNKTNILKDKSYTLLKITGKNIHIYEKERKKLFDYTKDPESNLKEWEEFIIYFENLILEQKKGKSDL